MTVPWLENPKVNPEPPHNHHSAHDCDDQLPIFSRVGRGLSGDSLSARFETDASGATYLVVTTTQGDGTTYEERRRIDGGKLQCYYAFQNSSVPATFTLTFVYDGANPDTSWMFTTPAIPYTGDFDWDDSGIASVISLDDLAKILGIDSENLAALAGSDLLPVDLLPEGKNLKEYIDDAFSQVSDSISTIQSEIDGIEVGLPELPLSISNGGTGTDGLNFDGNLLLIYDPTDNRIEELSVEDAKTMLGVHEPTLETEEVILDSPYGYDFAGARFYKYDKIALLDLPGSLPFLVGSTAVTIPAGQQIDILGNSRFPQEFAPIFGTGTWGVCRFCKVESNGRTWIPTEYFPQLCLYLVGDTPGVLKLANLGGTNITLQGSNNIQYRIHGSITYLLR